MKQVWSQEKERDDLNWRDIPGYNGAYQISNEGEVRTWKYRGDQFLTQPKLMTQFVRGKGKISRARFVKLTAQDGSSRDVSVLGLMVNIWMGGPRPGMYPYHKNGDLRDHCINNIGFATRKDFGKMFGGSSSRIPVKKVTPAGEVVEIYPSARQAAKANHMSYQTVLDRCNGKVKKPFELDGHNYLFDR